MLQLEGTREATLGVRSESVSLGKRTLIVSYGQLYAADSCFNFSVSTENRSCFRSLEEDRLRLVKFKTNVVDARTMASGCRDHFRLKNMKHPLTSLRMDWEQEETTSFQSGFPFLTHPRHVLDAGGQPPSYPFCTGPVGLLIHPEKKGLRVRPSEMSHCCWTSQ